jgi:hypothetical protein
METTPYVAAHRAIAEHAYHLQIEGGCANRRRGRASRDDRGGSRYGGFAKLHARTGEVLGGGAAHNARPERHEAVRRQLGRDLDKPHADSQAERDLRAERIAEYQRKQQVKPPE